jgi:hypothetical protein
LTRYFSDEVDADPALAIWVREKTACCRSGECHPKMRFNDSPPPPSEGIPLSGFEESIDLSVFEEC